MGDVRRPVLAHGDPDAVHADRVDAVAQAAGERGGDRRDRRLIGVELARAVAALDVRGGEHDVVTVDGAMDASQRGEHHVAIRWIFGEALDIAEVLPFVHSAAPDDFLTFEWVGRVDHLGECGGKKLTPGANMTSVDAAIRYRTSAGAIEVALIEWKFVERYPCTPADMTRQSNWTRLSRYAGFLADPQSPVHGIAPHHLVVEPIYQLVRQQLLAWRMELTGELDATRVVVVQAAPTGNEELWRSVPAALGDDLRDVWPSMLTRGDRWVPFDTARLLEPGSPVSTEFRARYASLSPVA